MTQIVTGVVTFIATAVLAVLFVYPNVFNFVKSLFEGSDLGTIAGLAVCVLITGPLIWFVISVTIGITYLSAVAQDKAAARKRRAQYIERNRR